MLDGYEWFFSADKTCIQCNVRTRTELVFSREFVFSVYSKSMDGRCVNIFLCVSVGVYMCVD